MEQYNIKHCIQVAESLIEILNAMKGLDTTEYFQFELNLAGKKLSDANDMLYSTLPPTTVPSVGDIVHIKGPDKKTAYVWSTPFFIPGISLNDRCWAVMVTFEDGSQRPIDLKQLVQK